MVIKPGFFKAYVPSLGRANQKIPIKGTWPTYLSLRDRYNNLWRVKVETVGDTSYFEDGWTKFIADNRIEDGYIVVYQISYEGLLDFKIFDGDGYMTEGVGRFCGSDHVAEGSADASSSRRKRSKTFDWDGKEIFTSGVIKQPKNPYFVTKISKTRPSELYIPIDMIDIYKLELPEEIVLFDPDGRDFQATCRKRENRRTVYIGGWGPLCRRNLVTREDKCICEFVRREGDLCIQVSFVRNKEQQ